MKTMLSLLKLFAVGATASLFLSVIALSCNAPFEPSLRAVTLPYIVSGDIHFVHGDGYDDSRVLRATPGEYLSASLHSGRNMVAAIKARKDRSGRISDYNLVTVELANNTERNLLQGMSSRLACPQWSPDGAVIALWQGTGTTGQIVLYDVQTQTTRTVPDIPAFYDSCEYMGSYMRWLSSSEVAIFHYPNGIWTIGRNGTTQIMAATRDFFIAPQHTLSTPGLATRLDKLPATVVNYLFGSHANPRAAPISTSDGRYYFYTVIKEGWFARSWIERHDRRTNTTVPIKTVSFALYRE